MISFPPFYVWGRRQHGLISSGKACMRWKLHSIFYRRNETARAMDSETQTSDGVVVNEDCSNHSLHEPTMLFMS